MARAPVLAPAVTARAQHLTPLTNWWEDTVLKLQNGAAQIRLPAAHAALQPQKQLQVLQAQAPAPPASRRPLGRRRRRRVAGAPAAGPWGRRRQS